MSNRLTITAYSTALFSTWIFVDELGLLLDAGDGATACRTERYIASGYVYHWQE